jgi:EmrB/QacA subfamily drug resistance transporter
VLLGFLVVPMAMSGASAALPRIAADLGGSAGALQWVVTGYFLAATCFMLVAGSLGDLFGRRRIFRAAAVVYATGTFVAALANDILLLDAARTLSGVGSAGIMAGGGAIVASTYQGPARAKAFASVGTAMGVGVAFGPTLGGWLVSAFGWRAMFGTFAAAGVVVFLGTLLIHESRADRRPKVDLPGAFAFILGVVGLMYGVNQVAQSGWSSPKVLGCIAAGLAMLAVFVHLEQSTERPVLDLALVRNRPFFGWLLAASIIAFGTVGVLVYLPTYLQGAGGFSAREAGTIMLGMTLPILVTPQLTGRLVNRGVPARRLIVLAVSSLAVGSAWLTVLEADSGIHELIGPLLLIGVASGLAVGLTDGQAMEHVAPNRLGMASGLLNTARGGANVMVLSVFGAALVSLVENHVGDRTLAGRVAAGDLTGGNRPFLIEHYTDAWHVVLWSMAALCAVVALVVHHLLSTPEAARIKGS